MHNLLLRPYYYLSNITTLSLILFFNIIFIIVMLVLLVFLNRAEIKSTVIFKNKLEFVERSTDCNLLKAEYVKCLKSYEAMDACFTVYQDLFIGCIQSIIGAFIFNILIVIINFKTKYNGSSQTKTDDRTTNTFFRLPK